MKNIILFFGFLFLVVSAQAKTHKQVKAKTKAKTHNSASHHANVGKKKKAKKVTAHKAAPKKSRKTASVSSSKKAKIKAGGKGKKAPKVSFYPKEDCDKIIQAPVAFGNNRSPASEADQSASNKTLFK
jgi:hypothetical protein